MYKKLAKTIIYTESLQDIQNDYEEFLFENDQPFKLLPFIDITPAYIQDDDHPCGPTEVIDGLLDFYDEINHEPLASDDDSWGFYLYETLERNVYASDVIRFLMTKYDIYITTEYPGVYLLKKE